MSLFQIFLALLVGHALADYPLQGEFLAKAKNAKTPIQGVPWYQAMAAHALIHGGVVWAITGIWWLGVLEMAFHAAIDHCKCIGFIGFNVDQASHVICKLWWVFAIAMVLP